MFASWSYDESSMLVTNRSTEGDSSFFIQHGEWDLLNIMQTKHSLYYDCCPEPFSDVTFWVVLRRKPLYYIFNLIVPSFLLTITTLLTFVLPVESGEKVGLGVTLLLSLTVFLLLVAETMPTTSESIPLLGEYRL